jgi:hypothetical protein
MAEFAEVSNCLLKVLRRQAGGFDSLCEMLSNRLAWEQLYFILC